MKNFNLTQMLQGCSRSNEMTVSATNSGGGQTCQVKQQTRLTSVEEKWSEKDALSSTCLRSASVPLSFRSRYLRYAAMIFCVLVMSMANIGMAWAWDECYYVDGNVGWTSTSVPMGTTSSGNGSCFMYMETNHYFKFRIASKPVGESTNKELTTDGIGVRLYRWDSNDPYAAKYTGNPGIVEVHADQATGDNNYNPWIWLTRPTVYVRHNWNNAGWSNHAMTDNNDGTYTYIGQYSGSAKTNVGPCESCSMGGDYFKYFSSATLTGSPAKGDRCLFTYNSSGFRGYGGDGSNKGSLTITKLCSITYDGNGKTGGAVPTSQTDIVYNTSTIVSGNVGSLVKTGCAFIGWNTAKDGTGKFYLPGSSFTPTATSHTLYAQWLQLHEPGVYESSEGYNKSLKTYSGRKYEIYRYTVSSSTVSIFAGESKTTTSGDKHCVAQFATDASSNAKFGGWIMHNGGISNNTSKASSTDAEFSAVSGSYGIKGFGGQGYFIYVKGYDQFDLWGQDKKLSSDYYIKVYRDGSDVTDSKSENLTVRSYTLDPAEDYLIRIECLGNSDGNGDWLLGFSLRLPEAVCGATAPGTISKGSLSGCSLPLTADGDPASNNTWYWQSAEDGTDKTGTSGATKNVTSAGTYYVRSFYSTGSCWSDAQSVTVTASDLTPAAPSALGKSSITAKGVTLAVTDAANTNDYEFYVSTSSSAPEGSTPATHSSNTKSITITNLYAGTTFYAWARAKCGSNKSAWTALTGSNFTTSTVTMTPTLANVTHTSGATSSIGGSDYTAAFTANTGYSMPNPTVTIGGNAATSGTHYTWSVDGSVGTITIPANKINGNIVITMNSAATAPSSVSITGNYHIYPGETLELTATPTGGNGPKTYQWQKYMGSTWTNLAGETSNTYTKASVTTSDVGHYRCIVTCGGTASTTSGQFDVKCLQLYVYYNNTAIDLTNLAFTNVDATHAYASVLLGNSTYCYHFKVTDGCGNWWGNNGESGMSMSNHDNWPLDGNYYTKLWTSKAGTYRFNLEYNAGLTSYTMSVVYPSGTQAAGYNLYFANEETQWNGSKIYYRVGKKSHNNFLQMTLVSGTANLYKVTTTEYGGFEAWHIANNRCGGNSTSIYKTNTDDAYEASAAMMFNGTDIPSSGWTVIPDMSNHWAGTDDAAGCEFYGYNTVDGMKTDRVTISPYSNGTITVNYTNTSNVASTLTSGYADLAHTCIITPTATASTGYKLSGLTVNGSAHTSGSTYTVTAATTVAATFAAKQSAITFDKNGGTGGATGTTGTYGSTMTTVTIPTRLGYTFDGYWDAETGDDGSGTQYYNTDGTSARTWDKNTESATTLYAKWVAVECPAAGSGETVYKFVPVTSSSDNVASSSGAELTTSDYLSALVNGHVYAYGSSASNVTMTSSGVKVASSTGYLKLDFDCALIAGDQIKWKSDQNSINLCNTTSYNSSNDLTLAKSNSSYSTVDITSAMVGKQTLYLVYNTGVATMMYFEIIRPAGYSVTYKANGGTGSDVVRIHATAASLATVGFTRAGYNFTGWKTGASSGTDYAVGDEITEEVTLYAQWTCVTPTFGTNLSTSQVDYEQGASASALTVAATANGTGGNGTVSYQWYSNTTNSTAGATPLTGQTSTSYTPSTASTGTTYYFCVATNSSSGCSTTTTSNIAKIVVSEAPCFKITDARKKTMSDGRPSGTVITGGTMIQSAITGGTLTYMSRSGGTMSGNSDKGLIFDNANDTLVVELTSGYVFGVGGVITITSCGASENTCGFAVSGNSMTPASHTTTSAGGGSQSYTIAAADGIAGENKLYITRIAASSISTYFYSISVTGCEECEMITPTLTAGTTTLYTYPTATSTTLTLYKGGSDGTVTWTSSDASIASVSGSGTSATVTAVGTGSATITASIAADGTHCANSVTKTFTVTGGCGSTVIAGVTATSGTAGTPEGTLIASSSGYGVSLGSNTKEKATVDGYKIDGSKYMYLTLSEGNYFKSGDEVLVYIAVLSDIGTNPGIYIYTGTTVGSGTLVGSKLNANLTANTSTASENSIILSNVPANTSSIIIPRTTEQNAYIKAMKVKRHLCPEGVYEFTDATGDGKWSTAGNWVDDEGVAESLPTISDRVIISKPVTVDDDDAVASEVILDQKSPNTGKLTIDAGNALIIAGTLKKTTTGTSVVATAPADVIINSTRAVGTGALVMGSHDGTNAATVNFETKVKYDNGYVNQYLGSPFSDETPYVDYEIQLYKFVPQGNGSHGWWNKLSYGDEMVPFMGYNQLSNNTSGNYLNLNGRTGHLNASTNVEFTIANGKMYYNSSWPENMFANSWTAPIHINQFEDGDFTNVKKVIYIFNAGTPAQYNEAYGGENSLGNDSGDEDNEAAGTYTVIPVKSAAELSALGAVTTVIPAMQAFSVMATSSSPSLTLNFNRLVYTPATTGLKIEPTRAPKREQTETHPDAMRLRVRGENGWTANAYILGREDFTEGYDDGWDGEYMEGDGSAPQLYSATQEGYFVVNCVPEIEGTLMAFHPGRADNTYTLSFVYNGSETWYLNDVKEQKSTLISNETTYLFVSNAGDNAARFVISKIPYTTTEIATGVTNLDDETLDVQKVIYNDKVYIIRNGRIYGVDGHLVK